MSIKKFYTDVEIKGNLLAEGISIVGAYSFPTVDGSAGHVLTTDGLGNVTWQSLASLSLTTDDVIEGLNLYFTQERAEDTIGALIQNGTGLNWTYNDLANTLVGNVTLSPFSTTNLSEGVNLYFTNERVDDRVAALIQNGIGLSWTYDDISNTLTGDVSISVFDLNDVSAISPIGEGYVLTYTLGQFVPAPPVVPISICVSGTRKSTVTNVYMSQDEVDMFTVPYILPDDCELLYLSASSDTIATWNAEVHVNGSLVPGAVVTVSASKKAYIKFNTALSFNAGDEVQLYCNGSGISRPRISATFAAYQ